MLAVVPAELRTLAVPPVDARILAAAAGIAAVCSGVAALAVWLQVQRTDPFTWLRQEALVMTGAPRRAWPRHAAVVVHLGLSVGLVGTAMLAMRSFGELRWSRGFDHAGLMSVSAMQGRSLPPAARRDVILEVIRQTPGVESAAVANWVPYLETTYEDHVWKPRGIQGGVWGVGPGFFTTVRLP
jgi:hypothetical protein